MDPKSAQNNSSLDSQNPQPPGEKPPAPNPIEPGQFVVAGEDHTSPPKPAPISQNSPSAPALDPGLGHIDPPPPQPAANQMPARPQPGLNLAGAPPPQNFPPPNPAPQEPAFEQPNPAPYTPPPPTTSSAPPEGSSKIKSLRMFAIIAGVLVLLAVIGALVYIFVFAKKPEAATTTSTNQAIEEPSPTPARAGPGFGDLKETPNQATRSATLSASPKL